MKRWLFLGATALLAFVGVGIYRAGLGESPPPPAAPEIMFRNGVASGHRIDTQSWSAEYDHVLSNGDQTVLDLDGVKHGVIYKAGKPYLHVSASHMSVNTLTHDFNLSGPLHVEEAGKTPARSFDTTAAMWNDAAQQLTLAQAITVRSGAQAPLHVASLTFDVRSGNLEMRGISGPVRFK